MKKSRGRASQICPEQLELPGVLEGWDRRLEALENIHFKISHRVKKYPSVQEWEQAAQERESVQENETSVERNPWPNKT